MEKALSAVVSKYYWREPKFDCSKIEVFSSSAAATKKVNDASMHPRFLDEEIRDVDV